MCGVGAALPGRGDAVAGPAQRGGEVPGHVGGAAGAAGVAARRRAPRAPARHRGHRARQQAAAPRQLAPLALQTHHLQRPTALTLQSIEQPPQLYHYMYYSYLYIVLYTISQCWS